MKHANPRDVLLAVADHFDLTPDQLTGASRARHITLARHLAIWVLTMRFPRLSRREIGLMFGGRDHATVLNAIRKAEALLPTYPDAAAIRRLAELKVETAPVPAPSYGMAYWVNAARPRWIIATA